MNHEEVSELLELYVRISIEAVANGGVEVQSRFLKRPRLEVRVDSKIYTLHRIRHRRPFVVLRCGCG